MVTLGVTDEVGDELAAAEALSVAEPVATGVALREGLNDAAGDDEALTLAALAEGV